MTLPSKIKIGPFDYKTISWAAEEALIEQRYGEIDHEEQYIKVCEGLSDARELNVTLHEVLHGIFDAQGMHEMKAVAPHEEVIVTMLSLGLANVFLANPALIDWIKTKVEGRPDEASAGR